MTRLKAKTKTAILATALTLASSAAMAANYYGASHRAYDPAFADTSDPNSAPGYGWNGGYAANDRGWPHGYYPGYAASGYDAYASADGYVTPRSYGYQAQSGGNGSPASAGSLRGSTDRSSPNSPFASGSYGDGERY